MIIGAVNKQREKGGVRSVCYCVCVCVCVRG